jgi:DNA topoisomerase-6 subunit A
MAKKLTRKRGAVADSKAVAAKLSPRDKKTMGSIEGLADGVVSAAEKRRDPYVDIPSRTLANVHYSPRKRILEMGKSTNRRQLFDLSQAKAYMRTMLVATGCKRLLTQSKTTSLRGLYYMLKHTIEGTKENTFDDQSECDTIIEDVEVLLASLREELHLYADKRGEMVGNIILSDSGDEIDCSRMGSGGYAIPSIVEPEVIQFDPKKCDAKFVLHVEKGTVWQRFNEDKFWRKHQCILTHGAGQPPRGVRRMLYRLHNELKLPIYCVLDNDPWGYYIYSVLKQGSINLAFESQRMAVPDCRFLGLRSKDFERCQLSDSVKIALNDNDRKRAKQISAYPWFAKKRDWQREIEKMLKNDFKLEVESLISKDISYVTEQYVPARLEDQDWLD